MKKQIKKYWYLIPILLTALIVNENTVQWALAIKVGDHNFVSGFKDAFEHFTFLGYVFFTAFRLVPYAVLTIALFIFSKTKLKVYVSPVLIGGLIGIAGFYSWASWMSMRPFYTDEHVSSTTALVFLFIPFYAVPVGAIGATVLAVINKLFFSKKRKIL